MNLLVMVMILMMTEAMMILTKRARVMVMAKPHSIYT